MVTQAPSLASSTAAASTKKKSSKKNGPKRENAAVGSKKHSCWECSTCTFVNQACNGKCEVCGRPKNAVTRTQDTARKEPRVFVDNGEQRVSDNPDQPGAFSVGNDTTGGENTILCTGEEEKKEEKVQAPPSQQEEPIVAHVVNNEELENDIRQRILREQEEQVALENQVRQQIIKEAVRAEVIRVEHNADDVKSTGHASTASSIESLRPNNIKEHLFGDARSVGPVDIASSPEVIRARTSLPWSVYQNKTTKMWIASFHTNQKALEAGHKAEAGKACVSYNFASEHQARTVGHQIAPPKMLPFAENPTCHVCKVKFALFRRPAHCRNCGVCVCSSCSTSWPSKMVPETYNIKREASVTVCAACDWLSASFQSALLKGQHEKVIDLFDTGNVNLTTPFANVKGGIEVLYPVHCAVVGGNLDLLQWLVNKQYCPIQTISRARGGKKQKVGPLVSSKGRSILSISLSKKRIDFVRYLVSVKGMSFFDEKDLDFSEALQNFTAVLNLLPENIAASTASAKEKSKYDKGHV